MREVITTIALLVVLVTARAAMAQPTVDVPLTIDYATLSAALKRSVYTDNGRAQFWNGADLCQYLYAEHPVFSRAGSRVKLETDGTLSIGVAVGSRCLSPIEWNGIIEAESEPYVAGHLLKFRVADINLFDHQHQKTLIAGKGFDLIKQYFIPRIETFEFDLDPITAQLSDLAQAACPPEVAQRVKTTLASLRVAPELEALDDGVRAKIELTLPSFPTATAGPAPRRSRRPSSHPFRPSLINGTHFSSLRSSSSAASTAISNSAPICWRSCSTTATGW